MPSYTAMATKEMPVMSAQVGTQRQLFVLAEVPGVVHRKDS